MNSDSDLLRLAGTFRNRIVTAIGQRAPPEPHSR